jgi:probable HAF family extracellular repeat protein
MRSASTSTVVVIGLFALLCAPLQLEGAAFQGLDVLTSAHEQSTSLAVSGNGSVPVGRSLDIISDTQAVVYAVRWVDGGAPTLVGGVNSEARGASWDGSVIVGSQSAAAFRWTASSGFDFIGDLPGGADESWAHAVSSNGAVVVGSSDSASGIQAFRWTAEGMVGLGDLDGGSFSSTAYGVSGNGSVVVGRGTSADGTEAFRWTSAGMVRMGDLALGGFSSTAYDASYDGSVVVGQGWSADGFEAFRWSASGGMVGLGDLPGGLFLSSAKAVSADGSVVVGQAHVDPPFGTGSAVAFIWTEERGMRNLKEVLENDYGLDLTGWHLEMANDISADGQTIVGFGETPSGEVRGWMATLSDTDEPRIKLSILPGSSYGSVTFINPQPIGSSGPWRYFASDVGFITMEAIPASILYSFVEWTFANPTRNPSGSEQITIPLIDDQEITARFRCGSGVAQALPLLAAFTLAGWVISCRRERR